jgi:chemotaxis protein methyltransferase CheR
MAVSQEQFALLADLVRRRSGLALPSGKLALVNSKLGPIATRFGFRKVGALLAELEDEPEELARAVTEAMTTNETSFFRDPGCFEYIRTAILPALTAARASKGRLRFWCAAASTGQEAYSLAMLLHETGLPAAGWKIDVFATDLSREAVARMRAGLYAEHEMQRGLPPRYRSRYFTREGDNWRVSDHLRRSLRVRPFNLLDNYGWLGQIDVILCRNVFLYFDHRDKTDALSRLERSLAPDGWLILGATESAGSAGGQLAAAGDIRGIHVKARNAASRPARLAG